MNSRLRIAQHRTGGPSVRPLRGTRDGAIGWRDAAQRFISPLIVVAIWLCAQASLLHGGVQPGTKPAADPTTLRGKILCGYQGWFRCPGDPSDLGWIHWSRDSNRIAPDTLTFEMWPDMSEYGPGERFAAPGFSTASGKQAYLFSSDNAATVLRHFQWMRDYGIDGAFLQHFAVDLPGGPAERRYPSRRRVMEHVRSAAAETGRVWALTYDVSGMPTDRIFDVVTHDWKKLVDEKVIADPRYLHEGGKPVVQIFGFYWHNPGNAMTAELANRLIDFFKTPGPYNAFLAGGGDWNWRRNPDPQWQAFYRRFDAYSSWNVGNVSIDRDHVKHAAMSYWADDKKEFESAGGIWMPVVYPGFSWDNLKKLSPGKSIIPRLGGKFLWEQFVELSKLKPQCVYVAMFDEVDEGTAIFKVSNDPPTNAHFVGYENLPADWYLRLVGEGGKMLRGELQASESLPLKQ